MSDANFTNQPPAKDPFSQADPYRTPESYQIQPRGTIPGMRPTALTVVCVLAIVLAVLISMTSASAAVIMPFQKAFAAMFAPPPTIPNGQTPTPQQEMQQVQSDMQRQAAAVSEKFFWILMPLCITQVIVSIWMIVAAVRTLSLSQAGRASFVNTLFTAIFLEALFAIPHILTQIEMQPITATLGEKMGKLQPGLDIVMKVSVIAGVVLGICMIILRVGFYAYALTYLRREEIVKLCDK